MIIRPGLTIEDRYVIQNKIDEGKYGVVYLAHDLLYEPVRTVAIKTDVLQDEANVLKQLASTSIYIPQFYAYAPNSRLLIMQYIPNTITMKNYVFNTRLLNYDLAYHWINDLLVGFRTFFS